MKPLFLFFFRFSFSKLLFFVLKALHWAAALGRTGVVRLLLLQGGCSPDDMAIDGSTPLHWAVSGGYSHCVQELLSGGAGEKA